MSQQNILLGQTPLTVSDFIKRLQAEDQSFWSFGIDFITPFKIALPQYASQQYQGDYYKKASPTSAPISFSSAKEDTSSGKFFEIDVPSDCVDDGINSVQLFYGSAPLGQINNTLVVHEQDESQWDLSVPDRCYWKMDGRIARIKIGTTFSASTGLAYGLGYERFPTYPSVVTDSIDAPAEDIDTLYKLWVTFVNANVPNVLPPGGTIGEVLTILPDGSYGWA